ncbi:MAG: signal peptidase [Candidatus Saccharibacteria bacterium]|nr:signal peptidase [Candidatus Saccharibacteria bacterium]
MASNIQIGNAELDSSGTRGWLIGSFIEEKFGLRHTADIELKWGVLKTGDARNEWATGETRTTIGILISGKFTMEFRDQSVTFDKPGDYVMWGPGTSHRWKSREDAVWLTIRWPPEE